YGGVFGGRSGTLHAVLYRRCRAAARLCAADDGQAGDRRFLYRDVRARAREPDGAWHRGERERDRQRYDEPVHSDRRCAGFRGRAADEGRLHRGAGDRDLYSARRADRADRGQARGGAGYGAGWQLSSLSPCGRYTEAWSAQWALAEVERARRRKPPLRGGPLSQPSP